MTYLDIHTASEEALGDDYTSNVQLNRTLLQGQGAIVRDHGAFVDLVHRDDGDGTLLSDAMKRLVFGDSEEVVAYD